MLQYLEYFHYRLRDLVHFRPGAYYRLFALYNADLFPAQFAAVALGLAILALLWRGGRQRGRIAAAVLVACWLIVAWFFVYRRLATIHLAGAPIAAGFALEAVLIAWVGVVRDRLPVALEPLAASRIGLFLFLLALLFQPLIAPLSGRPWAEAELFGLMPDPTVVATLGLLLTVRGRTPWLLLPLPILWCVVQGTTLWLLKSPEALLLPAVAVVTAILAAWKSWAGKSWSGGAR